MCACGYHIHQREYIKDLLKEWGLHDAKGSEHLKEEAAQYVQKEAASEDFWGTHGEVEEEIEKTEEDVNTCTSNRWCFELALHKDPARP